MSPEDMTPDPLPPHPEPTTPRACTGDALYYRDSDVALIMIAWVMSNIIGHLTTTFGEWVAYQLPFFGMAVVGGLGMGRTRVQATKAAWREQHPGAGRFLA